MSSFHSWLENGVLISAGMNAVVFGRIWAVRLTCPNPGCAVGLGSLMSISGR
ncbi:hypothetical protein [Goodfellowiella coeruleoviolacea]|uniref:hypothetical protein n=1 Tax=Goodfellowiella coeruleoviolacea TaxID=334858 RepID=UPI0020A53490|nr:hypothetical protein [Goodfellowiella coeruleoviolacea]